MKRIVMIFPLTGPYGAIIKDLPLSLLYAARIIYDKGYNIKIIDQRIEKNWKNILLKELKQNPICVAISCMTGAPINHALEISKLVKKNSKVPVVWGGVHNTILPEQTLKNKNIDIIIIGEGETTFNELIKALEKKKSLNTVKGIYYKEKKKIIKNPDRPLLDLNKLPKIPYELVDINKYYRSGFKEKIITIITSYDCPHRCGFCHVPAVKNRKWRAESVDKTIKHLKYVIQKYHPTYIFFGDSDFFVDLNRAKKIFEEIKKQKFNINFGFRGVRIDEIDRMDNNLLKLMEEINVKHLHIGAESGSQRILNLMRKDITVEQIISSNRKLKNYSGLIPVYNFITGIPTETKEELFKTTKLILKLLKENPHAILSSVDQFVPYPRTFLFDLAVKYGYKPPKSLEEWAKIDVVSNSKRCPWVSKRRQKMLELIYISSLCIDKKIEMNITSKNLKFIIFRFLVKLYRPFAKLRMYYHITALPIEIYIRNIIFKCLSDRSA